MVPEIFPGGSMQQATVRGRECTVLTLSEEQEERMRQVTEIAGRAKSLGATVDLNVMVALGIAGSSAVLEEVEDRATDMGAVLEMESSGPDGGMVRWRF